MSLSDRYFNQATIKSRLIFHLQALQHMPNFSKKSDYRISADFHMYVNTGISAVCSIWRNENKNVYKQIENNASTWVTNCFSAQERVILVFINTKKTKHSTEQKNSSSREYIQYFISYKTQWIHKCRENDDLNTSSPCLTRSVSFCWWHYNRLLMMSQWPDNCGVITYCDI